MSNLRKRNLPTVPPKSEDELMLEITEELMASREPLDFQSYQRMVAEATPNWPIDNPDAVMEKISVLAQGSIGKSRFEVALNISLILRAVSEICDYIPIPMERVAYMSTMEQEKSNGLARTKNT